jgi:hypothetical protein
MSQTIIDYFAKNQGDPNWIAQGRSGLSDNTLVSGMFLNPANSLNTNNQWILGINKPMISSFGKKKTGKTLKSASNMNAYVISPTFENFSIGASFEYYYDWTNESEVTKLDGSKDDYIFEYIIKKISVPMSYQISENFKLGIALNYFIWNVEFDSPHPTPSDEIFHTKYGIYYSDENINLGLTFIPSIELHYTDQIVRKIDDIIVVGTSEFYIENNAIELGSSVQISNNSHFNFDLKLYLVDKDAAAYKSSSIDHFDDFSTSFYVGYTTQISDDATLRFGAYREGNFLGEDSDEIYGKDFSYIFVNGGFAYKLGPVELSTAISTNEIFGSGENASTYVFLGAQYSF